MRLPAVSPPMSSIALWGLRMTAQMSDAAFVTAGTILFLSLGTFITMPMSAATSGDAR